MRAIPLTQNKIALVDNEDYERLKQYNWRYVKKGNRAIRGKNISMAHEVLQITEQIDHKDNFGLNYQKHNLRICTNSQNQQNRNKQRKKASSKYKGVQRTTARKWRAGITLYILGKSYRQHLGYFSNEEEAARVYDKAARIHFKEFAALNFPKEGERCCLPESKALELICSKVLKQNTKKEVKTHKFIQALICPNTHKALKCLALGQNLTIAETIRKAINFYLKQKKEN